MGDQPKGELLLTVALGEHVAHLDVVTGNGLLVLPNPRHDVPAITGAWSLHAADWRAAVAWLRRNGWDLTEDEKDHGPLVHGVTVDGRKAVTLYCLDPVSPDAPFSEHVSSWEALSEAGGVRA